MSDQAPTEDEGSASLVSIRTMEIVVAALLIGMSSLYIWDSWRIGFGWIDGEGPAAGFFPFWIALIMGSVSVVNLSRALVRRAPEGGDSFVSRTAFSRVLMVLVPTAIYVLLIQLIGIYVASALFIVGFMLVSREPILRSITVGIGVPIALFFMFEKWFLVPLPKGPLEVMLGVG